MNIIFSEMGLIVVVAAGFAMLARLFKQPPLLGYVLAGIALGPLGLGHLNSHETLDALKEIGITLLLFLVGLELDWEKTRHQLKSASVLAFIQAAGAFVAGFCLALLAGYGPTSSAYIGAVLAFSSTVIVIKFLSESGDLNSLHGRLAVGILLVEDFIALLVLAVAGGFSSGSNLPLSDQIILLVVRCAAIFLLIWAVSRFALPSLFVRLARSAELLFLSSLAWCFLVVFGVTHFGLSLEMGAFLAGLSLASLPYGLEIINRLRSLRDFFVVMFFASLGASLVIPGARFVPLIIGLVIIATFLKPIINFLALCRSGYRSRTAFLTALPLSQISEFSLIVVGVGAAKGHIGADIVSAITFATIISIFLSTVLFGQRNFIYRHTKHLLRDFEKRTRHDSVTDEMEERLRDHIIIFGYHRMGYHILKKLHQLGHRVVVVDFNPDIVRRLNAQGVDAVYGDAEDEEIFEAVHTERASMIVSTIPHRDETTYLIEHVKELGTKTKLIVTANDIDDALHYYKVGADYVILPHLLGGEHVADLITHYQEHNLGQYMKHRAEELKLIRARKHALYLD